jgi:hypothetical protein
MPFALMSGRKDGLFFVDMQSVTARRFSGLSAAPPASYANVAALRLLCRFRIASNPLSHLCPNCIIENYVVFFQDVP